MKAIELEMNIGKDGTVHLPPDYQTLYGQTARFVILLPDEARQMDPMHYSNTLDWPVDGLKYQQGIRQEWE